MLYSGSELLIHSTKQESNTRILCRRTISALWLTAQTIAPKNPAKTSTRPIAKAAGEIWLWSKQFTTIRPRVQMIPDTHSPIPSVEVVAAASINNHHPTVNRVPLKKDSRLTLCSSKNCIPCHFFIMSIIPKIVISFEFLGFVRILNIPESCLNQ